MCRPALSAKSLRCRHYVRIVRISCAGTGRVFTNAVVIVEDKRVRSVANGASIPSGAEMIDLSQYTGVPGLIDAHTHVMWYWDGTTTPRYEPPRHPAVTVFPAQENAIKALEAGVKTIRNLNAPDGDDSVLLLLPFWHPVSCYATRGPSSG